MNSVLFLLILVIVVLSIVLVSKISDLMTVFRPKKVSDHPADSYNKLNASLFIWALGLMLVGTFGSFFMSTKYFLPEATSIHGKTTDALFWNSMMIITIVFVIVLVLLFGFAYLYQYKEGRKATFYIVNHRLELIWTAVPAVVMAGLVFTGWKAWTDITKEAPANAQVIEITGKQFNWITRYPGIGDKQLGKRDYRLIDNTNEIGINFSDPNSIDDFIATELYIPKGRPIELKIRARDVIHSVFLPHFRVKMDAVPGMETRFCFTATKTTKEMQKDLNNPKFKYELACTEICGRGHFGMKMNVIVVEENEFNEWMAKQKTFLANNQTYLAKVPKQYQEKAKLYFPKEEIKEEVKKDSTVVTAGL